MIPVFLHRKQFSKKSGFSLIFGGSAWRDRFSFLRRGILFFLQALKNSLPGFSAALLDRTAFFLHPFQTFGTCRMR